MSTYFWPYIVATTPIKEKPLQLLVSSPADSVLSKHSGVQTLTVEKLTGEPVGLIQTGMRAE